MEKNETKQRFFVNLYEGEHIEIKDMPYFHSLNHFEVIEFISMDFVKETVRVDFYQSVILLLDIDQFTILSKCLFEGYQKGLISYFSIRPADEGDK